MKFISERNYNDRIINYKKNVILQANILVMTNCVAWKVYVQGVTVNINFCSIYTYVNSNELGNGFHCNSLNN